jgi:hypothetical protein
LSNTDARKLVEKLSGFSIKNFNRDIAGKIYIFNRIFCKVPEKSPSDSWKVFGGWLGIETKDENVNSLFPLQEPNEGDLKLVNSFSGYMGPPYQGLAEFDFLIERFGRRFKEK